MPASSGTNAVSVCGSSLHRRNHLCLVCWHSNLRDSKTLVAAPVPPASCGDGPAPFGIEGIRHVAIFLLDGASQTENIGAPSSEALTLMPRPAPVGAEPMPFSERG